MGKNSAITNVLCGVAQFTNQHFLKFFHNSAGLVKLHFFADFFFVKSDFTNFLRILEHCSVHCGVDRQLVEDSFLTLGLCLYSLIFETE